MEAAGAVFGLRGVQGVALFLVSQASRFAGPATRWPRLPGRKEQLDKTHKRAFLDQKD